MKGMLDLTPVALRKMRETNAIGKLEMTIGQQNTKKPIDYNGIVIPLVIGTLATITALYIAIVKPYLESGQQTQAPYNETPSYYPALR